MAGLTLPFEASQGSTGTLFQVTCNGGGGVGIFGGSYGTDQFGDTGTGVVGESDVGQGVYGGSQSSQGVSGQSQSSQGVYGYSDSDAGVSGWSNTGQGVVGQSQTGNGGSFESQGAGTGVFGSSQMGNGGWFESQGAYAGVFGTSSGWDGVHGTSSSPEHAGVGANNSSQPTGKVPSGFGLWASSNNTGLYVQGTPAGYFEGDVLVTGDMVLLNSSGDVAEDFDVEAEPLNAEPGTVLIINENGNLCASDAPYDTRVAGVVAGAGNLKPAVVLQRVPSQTPRSPIALVGKAFCKTDATFGRVIAGDLLTSSPTPGHAMKAADRSRAFGAIIGKALAGLDAGVGLIPILVSTR